jgi:hypothetical protein
MPVGRLCLRVKLLSLLPASWWMSSHYEATDYNQSHLSQLQPLLLVTACPLVSEKDLNMSEELFICRYSLQLQTAHTFGENKKQKTWTKPHFCKSELNHKNVNLKLNI